MIPQKKVCYTCKEEKDRTEFGKDRKKKDGLCYNCKKCQSIDRQRSERKATRLKWLEENREKVREKTRKYDKKRYEERGEELKAYRSEINKRYYIRHKERILLRNREWERNNPEKAALKAARRRARKRENGYEYFTHEQLIEHWIANEIDPTKCFYCKEADFQHTDHYIPIAKGGPHHKENLRPACARCNQSKHDKLPEVWLEETNSL